MQTAPPPSPKPQAPAKAKPLHSRSQLQVLVIDDDDFQLGLLATLLKDLGFIGVTCVSSGAAGMQKIISNPNGFQLILIDLHMPGMDGFAFMEGLARANFRGAMIIVSGQSEAVLHGATLVAKLRRFSLLGALTKPVDRSALSALIVNL